MSLVSSPAPGGEQIGRRSLTASTALQRKHLGARRRRREDLEMAGAGLEAVGLAACLYIYIYNYIYTYF